MKKVVDFAKDFVQRNQEELKKWQKTKATVSDKYERLRAMVVKDPGYKEALAAMGPVVVIVPGPVVIIIIIIIIISSGFDNIDFSRF
jgi:hypothetical protein